MIRVYRRCPPEGTAWACAARFWQETMPTRGGASFSRSLTSAPEGTATGAGSRAFFLSRPQAERGTPLPGADCPGDIPCSTALSALEGTARRPGPERRTSGAEQNGGRCRGIAGPFLTAWPLEGAGWGGASKGGIQRKERRSHLSGKLPFFCRRERQRGRPDVYSPRAVARSVPPFAAGAYPWARADTRSTAGACAAPFLTSVGRGTARPFQGPCRARRPGRRGGLAFSRRARVQPMPRRGNEAAVQGLRSAFRPAGLCRGAGEGRKSAARAFPQGLGRWFRRVREASALP